MIPIDADNLIVEGDLRFTFSASGGPGGQNVNKVATRATLLFDVRACQSLRADARDRILAKLASRISAEGVVRVTCNEHRTQEANRKAALERFVKLLRAALHRPKPRRPTRPTKASKTRRIEGKRARSTIKRGRAGGGREE